MVLSKSSSSSKNKINQKSLAELEDVEGDKYVLIDAGGGTVDIVVHEILNGKSVKEIFHPSGELHGGVRTLMSHLRYY